MKRCLITAVTNTAAMKIKYVLERNQISAEVVRLPARYTAAGCSFGVEIPCADEFKAYKVLSVSDVSYGKFIRTDSGVR